jgi:cytochrome bd ubiquinol oxidase subunit II
MSLNDLWFCLLGVLLAGYAVLDGFDLGAGIVYLGLEKDEDRRTVLNAIGPLWDGNEVWLVTFGGALFAAFPHAYATAFSAYYTPFMALLFALIFRAVSIEFRSKRPGRAWRRFWDGAFFGASALATLLFGVAVGSSMRGLAIGPDMEFQGGFRDLLGAYPLLVGFLAVAMFALHGCLYLYLKTSGELQERIHGWIWRAFGFFLVLYLLATIFTLAKFPSALRNFETMPAAWAVVVLNVLAVANIPRMVFRGRPGAAFASSIAAVAALVFLFGFALYPNLIVSSADPAWSLTIHNAASSPKTLRIMAWIALLGMPFVLAYTAVVYWVFRGKVETGKFIY